MIKTLYFTLYEWLCELPPIKMMYGRCEGEREFSFVAIVADISPYIKTAPNEQSYLRMIDETLQLSCFDQQKGYVSILFREDDLVDATFIPLFKGRCSYETWIHHFYELKRQYVTLSLEQIQSFYLNLYYLAQLEKRQAHMPLKLAEYELIHPLLTTLPLQTSERDELQSLLLSYDFNQGHERLLNYLRLFKAILHRLAIENYHDALCLTCEQFITLPSVKKINQMN